MKKSNVRSRLIFTILFCFTFVMSVFAQQKDEEGVMINGVIKDEKGIALSGVTITGGQRKVISDAEGKFVIKVPNFKTQLLFSYVGFKSIEVKLRNNQTNLNIRMEEEGTNLEEVTIRVGYGVQKKSDITGAISSIKNKDLKDQPISNLAGSIQGKVSGIQVTTPSGTPGAGLIVNIRGASNPLYVVDGVPMLSENTSSLATAFDATGAIMGAGQSVSSISDINPDDIESLEILKDASAAAIYGARAANGVVLVTTKRGKAGETSYDFSTYQGFQEVIKKLDFMDANGFVNLIKEARQNDLNILEGRTNSNNSFYTNLSPAEKAILISDLQQPLQYSANGTNTNWQNEIFRLAPMRNYELSTRGGTEKTKFYLSGSYFDQQGIVIESYFNRLNGRLNLDHQASKNFSYGTSIMLSRSHNKRSFNDNTYSGIVTNMIGASPLMPPRNPDGTFTEVTDYQTYWMTDNPVKSASEIRAFTVSDRAIANLYAEYKFLPSLKLKSSVSLDYNNVNDNQYLTALTVDAMAVGGKVQTGNYLSNTWLNENILTWNKTFNDAHNLSVLGGITFQESESWKASTSAQGLPLAGNLSTISSAATLVGATQNGTSWFLNSYLSRINYDYKGKYLLAVTLRADGSSRFSKSNRFGFFPSVSTGWNIAQEDFMKSMSAIGQLKLRVSYGTTGDQEIGDFKSISYWRPVSYLGQGGLKPFSIADANLSWQSNTTLNFGLDFELFKVLNGSVEYFVSNRFKLLGDMPIAGTTGYASMVTNGGKVQDKGLEVQVSSNNIKTKDFSWTSSFNISFMKNTIKELLVDNQKIQVWSDSQPTHILKVGESVGTFYGIKYAGVDAATGDPLYYKIDGTKVTSDKINYADDAQIIGKARPDFFGGLTNNFKYKNFDFTIATQFSVGNEVYNIIRPIYQSLGYGNGGGTTAAYSNNTTSVDSRWRNPGDVTNIPRASFVTRSYINNSDQFLENGSFFRIKTINLGYTLPKVKFIRSLRVYAQIQNLLTLTKYQGYDPEVSSTGGAGGTFSANATAGLDYAAYPPSRTYTIGLNVGF